MPKGQVPLFSAIAIPAAVAVFGVNDLYEQGLHFAVSVGSIANV
jgi:hypothetical protein